MTTAPVMTITEELLADLHGAASALSDGEWFDAESAMGCTGICREDAEFIAAANPATILALIDHIRSLTARLEKAGKDAERYRWLRDQHDNNSSDYAVMKFSKRANEWLHLDWKLDAEIDRAIAQEGADHE